MRQVQNKQNFKLGVLRAKNSSSRSPYVNYGSLTSFIFHPKVRSSLKVFGPRKQLSESGFGRLASFAILIVWIGLLGLAALNRQNILDWWQLRNYRAPAVVAQLAGQDAMTAYARKIFYVNHPAIETKTAFPKQCPNNGGEQTIVLGCYHSSQTGIFLLNVSDPRLNGVEQVTAAHEMLHAAYDRLSSSDRKKVDAMLMDYYQHELKDPRLQATIAAYKKTEPHDVVNEMHSVFGTEVGQLPGDLEAYYARYFTDRAKVTAYAASYQSEFSSRQTAVAQDDAQLAAWKAQISATEADLRTKQTAISSEQTRLLSLKSHNQISSYNAGVPAYNRLVDSYNQEVDGLQTLIDQYNQLVASRNAVALEQDQLVNELSTKAKQIDE